MKNDDRPMNRRRFFREGLRELLKPLSNAVEPLERAAKHIGSLEEQIAAQQRAAPRPPEPHWLRPPGALPENDFRNVCSRCGECVRVCPAQCIRIDPGGQQGSGVPYIDVDTMPCV